VQNGRLSVRNSNQTLIPREASFNERLGELLAKDYTGRTAEITMAVVRYVIVAQESDVVAAIDFW
jgi:hypothetical protein